MSTVIETLAAHGLTPSADARFVFQSELVCAADAIRSLYRTIDYDHRPESPPEDRAFPYLFTEEFRRGYACFKYAVAKVIQPRSICEIGIGAGTGARAFLAAAPSAHYVGIDNGSKDAAENLHFIDYTKSLLDRHGYSYEIWIQDSMTLTQVPTVDLFHVDGFHGYENAYHDTRLAMLSGSGWVLIDDSRDFIVAAAALSAVRDVRLAYGVHYDWTYFEDTYTGSILVHRRDP